jgi:hypothetical protein
LSQQQASQQRETQVNDLAKQGQKYLTGIMFVHCAEFQINSNCRGTRVAKHYVTRKPGITGTTAYSTIEIIFVVSLSTNAWCGNKPNVCLKFMPFTLLFYGLHASLTMKT